MKEKILKDIGDTVVISDIYDETKNMIGKISMITITSKGIKYRATFDGHSLSNRKHQKDFWQEDIRR